MYKLLALLIFSCASEPVYVMRQEAVDAVLNATCDKTHECAPTYDCTSDIVELRAQICAQHDCTALVARTALQTCLDALAAEACPLETTPAQCRGVL